MREFNDLASFALHFASTVVAIEKTTHDALDTAAQIIEKDAKKRIGKYQPAVGPHPGWAVLTEETQAERERLGFTPNDPLLRTGGLRDSIQREVHGGTAVIGSKELVAAVQEFGNSRIPARPFMGPAAFANKKKIQDVIGKAAVRGLFGGEAIHSALGYDDDIG